MLASRSLPWVLGGGLLLLACTAKVVHSPDGSGGNGAGSLEGSSGEATFGNGTGQAGSSGQAACPNCPAASGVQLCCAEVCGYLNTESGECVPSVAGSHFSRWSPRPKECCARQPPCAKTVTAVRRRSPRKAALAPKIGTATTALCRGSRAGCAVWLGSGSRSDPISPAPT